MADGEDSSESEDQITPAVTGENTIENYLPKNIQASWSPRGAVTSIWDGEGEREQLRKEKKSFAFTLTDYTMILNYLGKKLERE